MDFVGCVWVISGFGVRFCVVVIVGGVLIDVLVFCSVVVLVVARLRCSLCESSLCL